jgi:putative ABC transport system substrate-binding protein
VRRRGLLGAAGAALAFATGGTRAVGQTPPRVAKVGYLGIELEPWARDVLREGLRRHGFEEGRNLAIVERETDAGYERLRRLADELVALRVDVIKTGGDTATRAAIAATNTIPIVMNAAADPVAAGLVGSFTRPGGNLTGFVSLNIDLVPKRLELLREILPGVRRAGMLFSPASPGQTSSVDVARETAARLGLELDVRPVNAPSDLAPAIAAIASGGAGALVPSQSSLLLSNRRLLAEFALHHRLPTIMAARAFVEDGGMASYSADRREFHIRPAEMIGRILNGAKPAEMPIERAARFELVLNLRTARALGVTIAPALIALADEVIE